MRLPPTRRLEEAAAAREKVVEAEGLVVRDPAGKKLASFGLADRMGAPGSFNEKLQSGSVCLEIYNKAGVACVDLGLKGLALFASVARGTYFPYSAETPDRIGMSVELGEAKTETATP